MVVVAIVSGVGLRVEYRPAVTAAPVAAPAAAMIASVTFDMMVDGSDEFQ